VDLAVTSIKFGFEKGWKGMLVERFLCLWVDCKFVRRVGFTNASDRRAKIKKTENGRILVILLYIGSL
jgi:hypothetical protein